MRPTDNLVVGLKRKQMELGRVRGLIFGLLGSSSAVERLDALQILLCLPDELPYLRRVRSVLLGDADDRVRGLAQSIEA